MNQIFWSLHEYCIADELLSLQRTTMNGIEDIRTSFLSLKAKVDLGLLNRNDFVIFPLTALECGSPLFVLGRCPPSYGTPSSLQLGSLDK